MDKVAAGGVEGFWLCAVVILAPVIFVMMTRGHQARELVAAGENGLFSCPPPSDAKSRGRPAADGPQDGDEDAGPDEGDEDAAPEPGRALHEVAHEEAADQRPDQADDDVAEDAVAATLHHHACQPAGDQPDDDPGDDPPGKEGDLCEEDAHV